MTFHFRSVLAIECQYAALLMWGYINSHHRNAKTLEDSDRQIVGLLRARSTKMQCQNYMITCMIKLPNVDYKQESHLHPISHPTAVTLTIIPPGTDHRSGRAHTLS